MRGSESTFVRIDDRLLHGQVLLAWAASLRPATIVLAHDEIAADPERRAIYASLGEGDYDVAVESLSAAAERCRVADEHPNAARLLVVVGSAADALQLIECGAPLRCICIGGLHHNGHKRRLLDYVYLSNDDSDHLRRILERGVSVEARDLPGSRPLQIDAGVLARLWPAS